MSDFALADRAKAEGMKRKFFSVAGSEYTAGITFNADPVTFSATAAFISIDNGASATGTENKNVFILPDYIKISCVTPPANGDGIRFVFKTDTANRWSSGGTSLTTLAANTFVGNYSSFTRVSASAQVHAGDLTLSAETSASVLEHFVGRPTFGAFPAVNGDEYVFIFDGAKPSPIDGAVTVSPQQRWMPMEPPFLGPGGSLTGHVIVDAATASASEWRVTAGWHEYHHDLNA